MFTKKSVFRILFVLFIVLMISDTALARPLNAALGTGFTYQGKLADGGAPANGTYDLEFKLYDALSGGNQVGSTVTKDDVTVTAGLFTVQLDFGNVFDGTALYLEVGVRPGSDTGAYTPLTPRQPLSAAPYALYANNASLLNNQNAAYYLNISNVNSGTLNTNYYSAYADLIAEGYSLALAGHDHWGKTWTGSGTGLTLSGGTYGVNSTGSITGIYASGNTGVYANGSDTGVYGNGATYGVQGTSSNRGVFGQGGNYGVYGTGDISGVSGIGTTYGLFGSSDNYGVYGTGNNYGVYGGGATGVKGITDHSDGYGVMGTNTNGSAGTGVYGSGVTGVRGDSNTSNESGVYGINTASNGYGIYGSDSASGGTGVNGYGNTGVSGYSSTSGGYGVYGHASGGPGTNYAGYFDGNVLINGNLVTNLLNGVHISNSPGDIPLSNGLLNINLNADQLDGRHTSNISGDIPINNGTLNTNLNADRLDGLNASNAFGDIPISNGILNTNLNADRLDGIHASNNPGDISINNGTLNINLNADLLDGTHAINFASAGHNHWGETWTGSGTGLTLNGSNTGLYSTGNSVGVYVRGNTGLYGVSTSSSGSAIYGVASGGPNTNYAGYFDGNVYINGSYTATGSKSAVVETKTYGSRDLYSVESPEVWFEDFGTGQLVNSAAVITIEAIFAQTVNLTEDYHVFLTPTGDCALYVSEKSPAAFTVRAMGGQTCSVAFDYRIVAKRLGYENVRLAEANTPSPADPSTGGSK